MSVKNFILATDIVPGQKYMIPQNIRGKRSYEPVEIICEESQGWLRGFVKIDNPYSRYGNMFFAEAHVKHVFTGQVFKIGVCRKGEEPWQFTEVGKPTLYEFNQVAFDTERFQLEQQLEVLQKRLEFLKSL
jgi:hypothetical protein